MKHYLTDEEAWMQSLGLDPKIIKQMVVPVPQTFVTMNGLVQETEYMLLTEQPWLQLSMNPAWPWMFGNCKLEISPNELKKPLKSGANNKIDGVHALLDLRLRRRTNTSVKRLC